jgi:hypothetical protein
MNKGIVVLFSVVILVVAVACGHQTSDQRQNQAQEVLLQEGVSKVGMPAIKNFREKKLLKDILEMRDQDGLTTYVYLVSEQTGKLIYFGEAIGYGIPYSTQYTNPSKADPNGLYSPASAEGTWVMLKDPNGKDVKPVYIEPKIIVSPFKLNIN